MDFTDHQIIKPPSPEEILFLYGNDLPLLKDLHAAHESRIAKAVIDPLNHGFEFPSWPLVYEMCDKWMEVFAFGGNGSSKSEIGAKMVVDALVHNPGAKIYCFAQDDSASVQIQQRYVYRYLPPEFKEKQKSSTAYLNFSLQNGFTGDKFILDVGDGTEVRECFFVKYSQYQANKSKFEGYEYGSRSAKTVNIGAWLDEYLENGELYNTLLYRIPRRGATILTTFTPINHMTPFVADKIKGSQVTKTIKVNSEAFPNPNDPKSVEWVREKKNNDKAKGGVGMVFFPSEDNPWAGFDNMITLHSHKSLTERLVRFHGIPSNIITSLFPKFSNAANVVEKRWEFDRSKHTCYMVADPAGRRSYSCLWAFVNQPGDVHIVAEFPERQTYGEWADFGSPNWRYGPASKKHIMSVKGYVEKWKEIEEEIGVKDVFERIGDSRAFATENDDSIDRFMAFEDEGMIFIPSDGRTEEVGLQMLDEWFDYDINEPLNSVNRPTLTIHKSCENLIDSIINYNSDGKKDEALKDFIDLLRYLRMTNAGEGPDHVTNQNYTVTVRGKGGY